MFECENMPANAAILSRAIYVSDIIKKNRHVWQKYKVHPLWGYLSLFFTGKKQANMAASPGAPTETTLPLCDENHQNEARRRKHFHVFYAFRSACMLCNLIWFCRWLFFRSNHKHQFDSSVTVGMYIFVLPLNSLSLLIIQICICLTLLSLHVARF